MDALISKNKDQKTVKLSLLDKKNLSNYDVIEPLGRGSFSFVYKVFFKPEKKYYAMKVMEAKSLKCEEKIKNEISIHKSLDHPSIVKYFDDFRDGCKYFLILEYC